MQLSAEASFFSEDKRIHHKVQKYKFFTFFFLTMFVIASLVLSILLFEVAA